MLQEHGIVKAVSAEWFDILEPGRDANRRANKKISDADKKAKEKAQEEENTRLGIATKPKGKGGRGGRGGRGGQQGGQQGGR